MAEEEFDKKDYNQDGTVSKKEEEKWKKEKEKEKEDNRDRLEASLMESEYSWAAGLIYSNDRLKDLFKEAIKEGWTAQKFMAKFKDTGYYKNHTESWLKTEALKQTKPAAYRDEKLKAAAKIRDDAAAMGVKISEQQAFKMSDRYLRMGYGSGENTNAYNDWLAKRVATTGEDDQGFLGSAGEVEADLLASLSANGFSTDSKTWKEWVNKTVRRVLAGDMKVTDAVDYIRRDAASRYPSYGEKMISEGKDLQDYAAGYISMMSEVLEIPEENLNVRDPKIMQAMMGMPDDKGDYRATSLFDFEKELRKDSRWKYTKNANDTAQSTANYILKSFGFLG
jgi:uncharacterized protein CbrC (UPF0167 family)